MARIGIMGGTFDPIHNGHLMLGRQACEEYGFDQVWFMPSGQPPHKTDHKVTDAEDRLQMVRLAIKDIPRFACSEFEIERAGTTYTAETLRLLAETYPEHQFHFIIGADSFFEIEKWYHPQEIMARVPLLVAGRAYPTAVRSMEEQAQYLMERYHADIQFLHCREMDVSSEELRRNVRLGINIRKDVPPAVAEYIDRRRLYTSCTLEKPSERKPTMDEQIIKFRKRLKAKLPPMRYEHSLSVSYTCMALAMRYGYDLQKAELAGLLHDCAKRFSDSELIEKCAKHGIELTEGERNAPAVIHAKYGAWMAEHKYGITDEEILSAIRCHTTGKPDMSTLDKILYIADYIEPRRDKASNLPQMRELAFKDLDKTMYAILAGTLTYLESKGANVDPMTRQAYDYFEANRKKPGRKKKKEGE